MRNTTLVCHLHLRLTAVPVIPRIGPKSVRKVTFDKGTFYKIRALRNCTFWRPTSTAPGQYKTTLSSQGDRNEDPQVRTEKNSETKTKHYTTNRRNF